MKPELKAQDCTDHDPIETWQPTSATDVDYTLCLHIGSADTQGADLFYVNVLSEAAACQLSNDYLAKRKKIIVKDYSWSEVMRAVDEIINQIDGSDWNEIAKKLNQRFDWEFENYRPYKQHV